MGVVVRIYIDILIIIITFPSPFILTLFFGSTIPTSLIYSLKCFFVFVYVIFVQYSTSTRTLNVHQLCARESEPSTCEVPHTV